MKNSNRHNHNVDAHITSVRKGVAIPIIPYDGDDGSGTSPVTNVVTGSNIGAVDDTWINQGSVIDCSNCKIVGVYVDLTVNDSTGNQLQILSYHTLGGNSYVLETTTDYQKTLGDADKNIAYFFNVEGISYIQVQTKATDVDTGGGTIGTVGLTIKKAY